MGKFIPDNSTNVKCYKRFGFKPSQSEAVQQKPNYDNRNFTRKRKRTIITNVNIKKLKSGNYEDSVKSTLLKTVSTEEHSEQNEFVKCKVTVDSNNLLKWEQTDSSIDLFYADEGKCNYELIVNKDFLSNIYEEVCLEGLDGITLEAFWKRLVRGLGQYPVVLNEHIQEVIWRILCNNTHMLFYLLPQPRGTLEIYDRYKFIDADKGVIVDVEQDWPEIYPFAPVKNGDVMGSCSTFESRILLEPNVISSLGLPQALKSFGMKLIVVADQTSRKNTIFNEFTNPTIELMPMEYYMLEKIGRSRELGEITQGNFSLGTYFKIDSRSVFHYRKQLLRHQMIGKQFFYLKSNISDQNKTGRLLHLRRFFKKVKPKQLIITEEIVRLLKNVPGYRIEYSKMKEYFANHRQSINKVLKLPEIHKYLNTQIICPYREIYPDATPDEWKCKNNGKEKTVKVLELKDPHVNVLASWGNNDEDSSDDEPVSDDNQISRLSYNVEFYKDVYAYILSKGDEGAMQLEIQVHFDVDLYLARIAVRKLLGRNVIDCKRVDNGKQRNFKYFARCLQDKTAEIKLISDPPESKCDIVEKILNRQKLAIENNSSKIFKKELQSSEVNHTKLVAGILPTDFTTFEYLPLVKTILNNRSSTIPVNIATFLKEYGPTFFKLTFQHFLVNDDFFKMNEILKKLSSSSPEIPQISFTIININEVYKDNYKIDYVTKLFLLRVLLEEIIVDENIILQILTNNKKKPIKRQLTKNEQVECERDSVDVVETAEIVPQPKHYKGTNFMGDLPILAYSKVENDIKMEILISSQPVKLIYDAKEYKVHDKSFTDRVISRMNTVIRTVNEVKVLDDSSKMLKIIEELEKKEGYGKKIDRRSLLRIYTKLVEEGYIRCFKLNISNSSVIKTQTILCHPSVDKNNSIIDSIIDQLKLRYFIGNASKSVVKKVKPTRIESPFKSFDVMQSLTEFRKIEPQQCSLKSNNKIGIAYGFLPKFERLKVLHEFLFYVIHKCCNSDNVRLTNEEVKNLFEEYSIKLSEKDLEEMPPIYSREISWKMFIPPLPFHKGWPAGWSLVCDLLLRLPLSVLVKVHNVTFEVAELKEFLAHPVKRHYLIKYTPREIHTPVLHKRRYLSQLYEAFTKLAYLGLLQFGPEKFKEKDQVFIYLNRKASLLDTTSSDPSYNKTTVKEYPKMKFNFQFLGDVEKYWYNLYMISMNTRLNARNVMAGQTIVITDVSANAGLVAAVRARRADEAEELDKGEIPGDQRGAGGLDSSLWCHMAKNWTRFIKTEGKGKQVKSSSGLENEKMSKISPKPINYDEIKLPFQSAKKKVYLQATNQVKPTKGSERKRMVPSKTSKSYTKISRKMILHPRRRRQYEDHIDKVLKKKLGKTKVTWDRTEDLYLLVSKAVNFFLYPKCLTKQTIPYTVVRDVLHRIYPKCSNKTSQAIQRRYSLLYAKDTRLTLVEYNFMRLFKIEQIHKYFSHFMYKIGTNVKRVDSEIINAYIFIMSFIAKHLKEVRWLLFGKITSSDYIANGLNFVEPTDGVVRYKDVEIEIEIKEDVIKSIVHSSLENSDKQSTWGAFHLFRVYQNYSDSLIREALSHMKSHQIISVNKKLLFPKMKKIHFRTPLQYSNNYIFSLTATYHQKTALEAFSTLDKLIKSDGRHMLELSYAVLDNLRYGQFIGCNELVTFWDQTKFVFCMPEFAHILNPDIEDLTELLDELATRWQIKLQKDKEIEEEDKQEYEEIQKSQKEIVIEEVACTSTEMEKEGDNNDYVPLDLTLAGGSDTIDKLKSWVTDCMTLDDDTERRSPSPEFLNFEEGTNKVVQESSSENVQKENVSTNFRGNALNWTLEEIKEGMMHETPSGGKRDVPSAAEMFDILSKQSYNDENHSQDETLESLKKRFFIPVYPKVNEIDLGVSNVDEFKKNFFIDYLRNGPNMKRVWEKLVESTVVKSTRKDDFFDCLSEQGGNQLDYDVALSIIDFLQKRNVCGALATDIKDKFQFLCGNLELHVIMTVLEDCGLVLRTGIRSVVFVYHEFQNSWLVKTFALTAEEEYILNKSKETDCAGEKGIIEEKLRSTNSIRIKIRPWVRIDGTINQDVLARWMNMILSYCLDFPRTTMTGIIEKFCFTKPVDLFNIVEILLELGCIDLYSFEKEINTLTSEEEFIIERPGTFLDHFDDMFIEPSNIAMTTLGSFFSQLPYNITMS